MSMFVSGSVADDDDLNGSIGASIARKLRWRIILPIIVLELLNSLDRVNVSFAALHMRGDIGLGATAYGLGVGIFFCGYLLFQYPSAWLLRRVGFRVWIAGTALSWGLVATSTAAIHGVIEFYVLRFLLGLAEAGFAPGILIFIRSWVPARYRAFTVALTMLAIPISVIIGGPLSGWLMTVGHSSVLAGWRFMFLVEGVPTLLLAGAALFLFPETPVSAAWLATREKAWLTDELKREDGVDAGKTSSAITWSTLFRGDLLACAGTWFCMMAGAYTLIYWLPLVIKQLSQVSDVTVGFLNALPWAALGVAMLWNGGHSDRKGERFWHIVVPMVIAATGISVSALVGSSWVALATLVIGAFGLGAAQGAFWAVPSALLTRDEAAAGVVMINIAGNLGGIVVPPLVGALRSRTDSFEVPVLLLGVILAMGAASLLPLPRWMRSNALP